MGIDIKIHLKGTILFEGCDDMSIWDYMQITEKGNLYHLVKSGKYPKKEVLLKQMEKINQEFAKLRGEDNMVKKFDMISYKEELILQVHFGAVLIDVLITQVSMNIIASKTFNDLISELESWGFYVDKEIPMIDALTNIKNEINDLRATIDSLEEELNPTQEINEIEAQEKGNPTFNMTSLVYVYGRILKIGIVKLKETSLTEFAVMEKQVEEVKRLATKNNAA